MNAKEKILRGNETRKPEHVAKEFLNNLNSAPGKLKEVENLKGQIKMKGFVDAIPQFYYWLKQEIGAWAATKVLLKSFTWDIMFKKPKWQPELLPIETPEDEKIWRDTFNKDVVWFLMVNDNLRKKYGEVEGDNIMARFVMPVGLYYQWACFKPIESHTHIDQLRQQLANYLGDGKTMRNRVWVSENGKECQYYYTKCMHVQIMRAYGYVKLAQASCMIDHVTFDKRIPTLKFKRKKTLSLGDAYCDHHFSIREEDDTDTPHEYYEDAHRADYEAYAEIQKLEKLFDQYGTKLRS